MQSVSTAWKENQKQNFVSESYVEIILDVGDPDAQAQATENDNGHESFSAPENIVRVIEKNPSRFATLEHNLWMLDGTMETLPDSGPYGEQGYIGNVLSESDGSYGEMIPTITITFSQVFTTILPGITITWSEEYEEFADTFRITSYNGDTVKQQVTVAGNRDLTTVVSQDISDYNKITIEIMKWCLPYRRARVKEINLGIMKTFVRSDIFNFDHEMTVDALSAALPKAEIVFEVMNLDGEYNPDNPEGFTKYLMVRQDLTARYGYKINGKIEWIKSGTFFLSGWEWPQNGITATFTARDALEYMNDVYTGTVSGTLYAIATAAFTQANLLLMPDGSNRWKIDSSLSSISVPSGVSLNDGTTIAQVLQYCANAACCVFYQDRDGIVYIKPLADGNTDYSIDRFVSYENSENSLSRQLKAVNINNGQYVFTVGNVGETQNVNNPLISDAQAPVVAKWIADYLVNRKSMSGEFRADPRLDALDRVTVKNKYAENTVLVTSVRYSYNGAFRGSYEGRQGV